MFSNKIKKDTATEKGIALTEVAMIIALLAVACVPQIENFKVALQNFQTAQYNANRTNTEYPPALLNARRTSIAHTTSVLVGNGH